MHEPRILALSRLPSAANQNEVAAQARLSLQSPLVVALLTGGWDRPYAFGIATALASQGVHLEVIAGDNVSADDFAALSGVTVLKLRHEPAPNTPFVLKA